MNAKNKKNQIVKSNVTVAETETVEIVTLSAQEFKTADFAEVLNRYFFTFLKIMTDLDICKVQYVFENTVVSVEKSAYRKDVAIDANLSSNKIYLAMKRESGASIDELLSLRKETNKDYDTRCAAVVKLIKALRKHNNKTIDFINNRYFCRN